MGTVAQVTVAVFFGAMALFGERWQRAWASRRLRRHHCPESCRESIRCRCGCLGGLHSVGARQNACGRCGTPIVYDEEDDYRDWGPYNNGAITQEIPRPSGRQTSWGRSDEEEV